MRRSLFLISLLIALIVFQPVVVLSFKPVTHVWVAQQVLNDLGRYNGKVEINGKFYDVPKEVADSLMESPGEYRLGHIGPDVFPDVLVGQMTTHPGVKGGHHASWWLESMLRAGSRNSDLRAFSYGFLGHAAGDIFAHTYVNTYSGDVWELKGEKTNEKRHFAIESFIEKYTPPLKDHREQSIGSPEDYLKVPFSEVKNSLILDSEIQGQYLDRDAYALHLVYMKKFRGMVEDFSQLAKKLLPLYRNQIDRRTEERSALIGRAKLLDPAITEARNNVKAAQLVVDNRKQQTAAGDDGRPENKSKAAGENELLLALDSLSTIERKKHVFTKKIDQLDTRISAYNVSLRENVNPLINLLDGWVGSINRAMDEYIKMGREVAIELSKENGKPLAPMRKWYDCWRHTFMLPIPEWTSEAICEAKSFFRDIGQIISNLRKDIREALGRWAWLLDPVGKLEDLARERLLPVIKEIALKMSDVFGEETKAFLEILVDGVTERKLDELFSNDDSGQKRLIIRDISERLRSDMHLDDKTSFNPTRFNAAYNAVVLSKMTLLAPDQLNKLAQDFGIQGRDLFSPTGRYNILAGAVRSIDGNHQWNKHAPPYLRQTGFPDKRSNAERTYGYEGGFILWADIEARKKIFRKVFKGPIAPSLETAAEFGFQPLIPEEYPYKVTAENPFPDIP